MRKQKNPKKPDAPLEAAPKKSWWKRFYGSKWRYPVFIVVALLIALGSYYTSVRNRVVVAQSDNAAGALTTQKETDFTLAQLKKDGDSRVNILLLGKGGDGHDGGNLTDSIQLLSVDIFNNTVSIMGIPRDLYADTKYSKSKINAVYSAAESTQKGAGGKAIKDLVGTMTDTTIHYFALIDFTGLTDMVDAIGGITVNVPKAIKDTEYPADDGSDHYVTFQLAAGVQHMDGKLALKYVRSRHSTSDFDRLGRQQQVIAAIKDKALSAGIVTNPTKLSRLMEAIANNFRTDMTPREVTLLFERVSKIDKTNISSIVLGNGGFGSLNLLVPVKNSSLGAAQQPALGLTNYTDIQRAWHKITPDPLVTKEGAHVRIQYVNAKSKKTADDLAALLADYGYSITGVSTSTEKVTAKQVRTYRGTKMQYSAHYLGDRLGVTPINSHTSDDSVDIDIILP